MIPDPEELEASLWRDLLDRWFPACIDSNGGYYQGFGPAFERIDDGTKALVFQSRMLWVCATVASIRPEFAEFARHGVRFLKERMDGGLIWSLDSEGVSTSDERHAYGISFAIYGLAAAGRLLGDQPALTLAKRAFEYLDTNHLDSEFGGYFEATNGVGQPILSKTGRDVIGTPYGQKSQNTHLHLMEAFTELYRADPDPKVRHRLEMLLRLFTNELFVAPGHLRLFVQNDWTPASTDTSFGHDIEAAHLMLDAADALGETDPIVLQRARALADNTLARGWDKEFGGIFYAGNDQGPTDRTKNWWAQAESLLGFATLWSRTSDVRYRQAMSDQWTFIRDHQIDDHYGGWHEETNRDGTPRESRKGHAWKAAYHDGRAMLFTARLLLTSASNG